MICPQCKEDMVIAKASAHGNEYYYCRNCKQELGEMVELEEEYTGDPDWPGLDFTDSGMPFKTQYKIMGGSGGVAAYKQAYDDATLTKIFGPKKGGSGSAPPTAPPPSEL